MVAFNKIPSNNLVPGAYAEFDKSAALQGTPAKPRQVLIMGIVPESSTGAKNEPKAITSGAEVLEEWGPSQLATLAEAFTRIKRDLPIDVIAVEEPSGGVAAVASLELSGTATEDATLNVYVNGIRLQVAVSEDDSATDIQAAVVTAINDAADGTYKWLMPLSAADNAGTLEVTADEKGEHGNDMTFSVASGPQDKLPAGITVDTEEDFTGGSGAPDLTDGIAAWADTQYDTVVTGETSDTELSRLEAEMADRWDPMVAKDGLIFGAIRGTHGDHTTYAGDRNSQFSSILGTGESPTPPWVWAAQAAARDAEIMFTPRPRFGRTLPDCEPPARGKRFDRAERQTLLEEGISTYRVGASGTPLIERLLTTYTEDEATGTPDPVYRNVSTMRNLAYLRWSWNLRLEMKYPDYNVADDGTQFDPGMKVVTPSVIRGDALAWFREMESAGRVEDFDSFKEALVVDRNASDVNRVDVLNPPDLINELVTIATRFAFRL